MVDLIDNYFIKLADKFQEEVGVVEGEPDIKIEGRSPKPSLRWEDRCEEIEKLDEMNKPPVDVLPARVRQIEDTRQYSNSAPKFDYEQYRVAADCIGNSSSLMTVTALGAQDSMEAECYYCNEMVPITELEQISLPDKNKYLSTGQDDMYEALQSACMEIITRSVLPALEGIGYEQVISNMTWGGVSGKYYRLVDYDALVVGSINLDSFPCSISDYLNLYGLDSSVTIGQLAEVISSNPERCLESVILPELTHQPQTPEREVNICFECMNRGECSYCRNTESLDDMKVIRAADGSCDSASSGNLKPEDELVCDDCFSDNFSYCDKCGSLCNQEEMHGLQGDYPSRDFAMPGRPRRRNVDEFYCDDCAEPHKCDSCAEYFVELNQIGNDNQNFCESCSEDLTQCEGCGCLLNHQYDGVNFDENNGWAYCDDCYVGRREETTKNKDSFDTLSAVDDSWRNTDDANTKVDPSYYQAQYPGVYNPPEGASKKELKSWNYVKNWLGPFDHIPQMVVEVTKPSQDYTGAYVEFHAEATEFEKIAKAANLEVRDPGGEPDGIDQIRKIFKDLNDGKGYQNKPCLVSSDLSRMMVARVLVNEDNGEWEVHLMQNSVNQLARSHLANPALTPEQKQIYKTIVNMTNGSYLAAYDWLKRLAEAGGAKLSVETPEKQHRQHPDAPKITLEMIYGAIPMLMGADVYEGDSSEGTAKNEKKRRFARKEMKKRKLSSLLDLRALSEAVHGSGSIKVAAEGTGYVDKRETVGDANKAGVGNSMIAGSEPNQKKIDDTEDTKMVFPHHKSVREAARKITANVMWASIANDCRVIVGAYREYCAAAEIIAGAQMIREATMTKEASPGGVDEDAFLNELNPTAPQPSRDTRANVIWQKVKKVLEDAKLNPQEKYEKLSSGLTKKELTDIRNDPGLSQKFTLALEQLEAQKGQGGQDAPASPQPASPVSPPTDIQGREHKLDKDGWPAGSRRGPQLSDWSTNAPQSAPKPSATKPQVKKPQSNMNTINLPQSVMPFSTWLEKQRGYAPSGEKPQSSGSLSSKELKMLRDVAMHSLAGSGMEVDGSVFTQGKIMNSGLQSLINKAGKYLNVKQDPKTNKFYLSVADDAKDKNMRVVQKMLMGGDHSEGPFKDDARLKNMFDRRRKQFDAANQTAEVEKAKEQKNQQVQKEQAIQDELGSAATGADKPYRWPEKENSKPRTPSRQLDESDYELLAGVGDTEEREIGKPAEQPVTPAIDTEKMFRDLVIRLQEESK